MTDDILEATTLYTVVSTMPRPRQFDKTELLQQAMILFEAKGYEGTSIRDLIEVTGISSSSMYEVFGDKRGIFLATLEHFCEHELRRVQQLSQDAGSAQGFIEMLFTTLEIASQPDKRGQGSLAFNTMVEFGTQDAEVTQILLRHYFAISEIVANLITEGQKNGTVTTQENAQALAYTFLCTLQGFGTVKGVKPNFEFGAHILSIMVKMLNP